MNLAGTFSAWRIEHGALPTRQPVDVAARTRLIAENVARLHADDVDRDGRFPIETIDELRTDGLLGALIPVDLGGLGAELEEVAEATFALATRCASSAMVFAMHQLQVACLLHHGETVALRRFTRDVAERQLLLGSATSEVGIGGQLRRSGCALGRADGRFVLDKQAPVISYGEYADAVLATARRSSDSPPSDQVLVVCAKPGLSLRANGEWDVFGMRGTCSPGFEMHAEGDEAFVLPEPFADIAVQTMLPVSHVLWAFVWLGIAAAAESRARRYVQSQARKNPGSNPPGATRLAELTVVYEQMDAITRAGLDRQVMETNERRGQTSALIASNSLKLATSTMVVDVVSRALAICGMAGFRERNPYSLCRHLRDAHSAALMVSNDRLIADNAQMLLIHREAK